MTGCIVNIRLYWYLFLFFIFLLVSGSVLLSYAELSQWSNVDYCQSTLVLCFKIMKEV